MELIKNEQFEKLQNLWSSGDLEQLERSIDKFNIFTALKLDNAEIRHSNFLAWLMNPRENHNLGDYFLKEFLKVAIKDHFLNEKIAIKPQDILNKRFYDCEIRREYKNIDILLINPDTNFLCLIENKIWSDEHSQQLERYADCVQKEFKGYKKLHIFLTPNQNPEKSLLERGGAYYVQMGYEQVLQAIEGTLKHRAHIMSDDARIFIEHYKKMVERNVMNKIDKDVMDFCKAMYKNHKEAIDLINRCTENISEDLSVIIKDIVENQSAIKNTGGSTFYFLPKDTTLKYGKDKTWLDGSIVGLYFEKGKTNIDFGISIQTADDAENHKRKELIDALEDGFKPFRGNSDAWRWLPLESISIDEFYDFENADEIKNYIIQKLRKHIDNFCNVIERIEKVNS